MYVYLNHFFQLDSHAFSNLNVKKHNYSEVDKLYLDNNQLDSLPEKLLKMRLKVRFSARNNKLTTVSYTFLNSFHHCVSAFDPFLLIMSSHFLADPLRVFQAHHENDGCGRVVE